MPPKTVEYDVLPQHDSFKEEALFDGSHQRPSRSSWYTNTATTVGLLFLLIASVSLNAYMFFYKTGSQIHRDLGRSRYSGLPQTTPVTYHAHTDYWGQNETRADELWDSVYTDPVAVAISDDWAVEHGLPLSARFPWDDSKGVYFVKVFHHMHCLKVLRRAFINVERGNHQDITSGHVHHCLDSIRQDVMCKADDTPMPITHVAHSVGDQQVMECRDYNKLVDWIHHPDRNACYKQISDYKPIAHRLERHAYCPKNSPYYDFQNAYFEKFGHKDPFIE